MSDNIPMKVEIVKIRFKDEPHKAKGKATTSLGLDILDMSTVKQTHNLTEHYKYLALRAKEACGISKKYHGRNK